MLGGPRPLASLALLVRLRMAPVVSGPSTPAAIASTTRAPNTMPSSSEFEANRFAPCTPEQLVSPAAHRPGNEVAPFRSVMTPPHWW